MLVVFSKLDNGRLCAWTATRAKQKTFQGTTMASGRDLPHDLAQFVVEHILGLSHGFWNLLANGATFKSVPGRRRTQSGQRLISSNSTALNDAEHLANTHVTAWRNGDFTPAGPALDAMYSRWSALSEGEEISLVWQAQRLPKTTTKEEGKTKKRSKERSQYAGRR